MASAAITGPASGYSRVSSRPAAPTSPQSTSQGAVAGVDRRELGDEEDGERDRDDVVGEPAPVRAPELANALHGATVTRPRAIVIVSEDDVRLVLEDEAPCRYCEARGVRRRADARSSTGEPHDLDVPPGLRRVHHSTLAEVQADVPEPSKKRTSPVRSRPRETRRPSPYSAYELCGRSMPTPRYAQRTRPEQSKPPRGRPPQR